MSMSTTSSGRGGRRRGEPHTREVIAEAARAEFARAGYDRATMRSIAGAAGVDPALIVHFFGSKEALFEEVMALPPGLEQMLTAVASAPRDQIGRTFARTVVTALESEAFREVLLGRVRSAASHARAAALVRQMVSRDLAVITREMGIDRPDVRAALAGMQVVGLAITRHVVGVEPLASMEAAEIVDLMAPVFQHLLAEPLIG